MFSVESRGALRDELLEHARADDRITGCAVVGSAARDEEDAWSDIDLALQLAPGLEVEDVAEGWSAWLGDTVDVADRLDERAHGALYRVFLLRDSLQVDVSFWPHGRFRSVGGPVRMVFGELRPPDPPSGHDPAALVRTGWLYAVHARSAVARGWSWHAETMLTEVRNRVVTLACLLHGLDPAHGRQAHALPAETLERLETSRARDLTPAELRRSLSATVDLLRAEAARHDRALAQSIDEPLRMLVTSVAR